MGRVRRRVPVSGVPVYRRILLDPAALRYWSIVALLALLLAGTVHRSLSTARAARSDWGRTTMVWVTLERVRAGDRLQPVVEAQRWPSGLVPPDAVDQVPNSSRAASTLDRGTPLTESSVAGGDGSGRSEATERMVALVADHISLRVRPGDVVDVWATTDPTLLSTSELPTQRVVAGARVVEADDRSVVVAVPEGRVGALTHAAALATVTLVGRS